MINELTDETLETLREAVEHVKSHDANKSSNPFSKEQKALHFLEWLETGDFQQMCVAEEGMKFDALKYSLMKHTGISLYKADNMLQDYVENDDSLFIHDGRIYTEQYANSVNHDDPRDDAS